MVGRFTSRCFNLCRSSVRHIFFRFLNSLWILYKWILICVLTDEHWSCFDFRVKSFNVVLWNFFRDFIEAELLQFTRSNPGIVVYLQPRRHRTPRLVAEYCNSIYLFSSLLFNPFASLGRYFSSWPVSLDGLLVSKDYGILEWFSWIFEVDEWLCLIHFYDEVTIIYVIFISCY